LRDAFISNKGKEQDKMRRLSIGAVALMAAVTLASVAAAPARGTGVLDQVKTQFNQDRGALRLVVLVSPTCPECTTGAEWIQEYILQRNPTLDVKVYAVWYQMYPGDSPKHFPHARTLIPDKRVRHYWDQPKDVGRWFFGMVPTDTHGDIEWDAFYLFDRSSAWTDRPTALLTWGRTILKDRKKLSAEIALLTDTSPATPHAVPDLPTGDRQ